MRLNCRFDPPHTHEFEDDWEFGGADGLDPRADPRWRPTTYEYFDGGLHPIYVTQTPLCDDQAIDEFTLVAEISWEFVPVYLSAKPYGGKSEMLGWKYDKATDTVKPL